MSLQNNKISGQKIHWQAHQSTNTEMPENTTSAMHYAWELGGIPEIDIRQTADGIIIGMHDATPKRTTTAPIADQDTPISELTFAQVQNWDAGIKFSESFRGEKIPSLEQVLDVLSDYPEREVYLDYKQVDLASLAGVIQKYGVERQVIFCHRDQDNCRTMKRLAPEIRTMLWIPDTEIDTRFGEVAEAGFDSLDMIQFHLVDAEEKPEWRYRLQLQFLQNALEQLREAGLELEVLIFHFDQASLFGLLDVGIRRFAVDEPKVFAAELERYYNK
ncbi:glycerophosphodiester phosphodiesterase [Paenibacillus radicis (ex Xue et al. 2023)]|uniref:Glycerophosphodiester phosphodiesterase family protein n=1 Tax=Paenibacillus radicis (ex Xue et al. 2023) TaxID=2972489 RepID=A0ABT1YCS2_9BACL|nr:glycerophosphodiester phosphodiesterase family protein [Paenibacillus radicis (ex Xue et al. 2023)]MCR8630999.1 glycerophosphodiester phosphodiesterase family protein [Paenibacillus radicis (ex Xue et al. 2023)]